MSSVCTGALSSPISTRTFGPAPPCRKPSREDLVSILWQMYKDDGVAREDVRRLVDRFRHQPLDFFGALRVSLQ